MSWKSGGILFEKVINILLENIPDLIDRKNLYIELIEAFGDSDYDNFQDHIGEDPAFDKAYAIVFGEIVDEDEDFPMWENEDDE